VVRLADGPAMLFRFSAREVLGDDLVGGGPAREDETAAGTAGGRYDVPAAKQSVTRINRPDVSDRGAMPCPFASAR
jgi:hypothetical protein